MASDRLADANEALRFLLRMKGEFVWFVRLSADNVLRMDFGKPHLKIREPSPHLPENSQAVIDALERRIATPTGQWHLFIAEGEWTVETKYYSCKRADTDSVTIDKALRQLDVRKLKNVHLLSGYNDWMLEFDLGGNLRMYWPDRPKEAQEAGDSQWTLFHEDGSYVSYTSDGRLTQSRRASS